MLARSFSLTRLVSACFLFSCFVSHNLSADAKLLSSHVKDGGVNVGSHSREFQSNINQRDYKLYINLPSGYQEKTSSRYPVLYVLDGQWYFANLVTAYGSMNYDGLVPDLIIVGVTWGGDSPNYGELRKQEMDTPKYKKGAELFLRVLQEEVIPLVDREYRTDPQERALTGGSLSGFYNFYAMFNAPDLFNGFVIWNPTIFWHDKLAFYFENEYFKQHKTLDARVYVAVSAHDVLGEWQKLEKQIRSHNYQKLQLKSEVVNNLAHSSTRIHAHAYGMEYLYKRPIISKTKKQLAEYEGVYLLEGQDSLPRHEREVMIVADDDRLLLKKLLGGVDTPLYPLENGKFAVQGGFHDAEFKRDDNKKVQAFRAEIGRGYVVSAVKESQD